MLYNLPAFHFMSYVRLFISSSVPPSPLIIDSLRRGVTFVSFSGDTFSPPSTVLGTQWEPYDGRDKGRGTGKRAGRQESTDRSQGRQVDTRFPTLRVAVLDLTPCGSLPL